MKRFAGTTKVIVVTPIVPEPVQIDVAVREGQTHDTPAAIRDPEAREAELEIAQNIICATIL